MLRSDRLVQCLDRIVWMASENMWAIASIWGSLERECSLLGRYRGIVGGRGHILGGCILRRLLVDQRPI